MTRPTVHPDDADRTGTVPDSGHASAAVAQGPESLGDPLTRVLSCSRVIYISPFLIQLATSFKTEADATREPARRSSRRRWTCAAYDRPVH